MREIKFQRSWIKKFTATPYADYVALLASLCPGGYAIPLFGKENLRQQRWAPLPSLLGSVEVIETFVNKDHTASAVEFYCIITKPACKLRIIDRFRINDEGEITEQGNFFDPRDITNPGWEE